jgi:hypothetical protein
MALTALISAASYYRIARGRDWLNARQPAEEVLIIGASPDAANELTRSLVREKRASFGYHRLTLGQLASALAQPRLTFQRTVPLGALGVQAVANRAIHKLSQAGGLGRYVTITSGPGFARAIANVITELRLNQIEPVLLGTSLPISVLCFRRTSVSLRSTVSPTASMECRHSLGQLAQVAHPILSYKVVILSHY